MPFFGIGMKTGLFQSCGHCWVFQICWHIECSTFTASFCRIWSSSAGIPSPSLALLIVMLPKVHLTSHSRMSGSRWVITPSWLPGSWIYLFCIVLIWRWNLAICNLSVQVIVICSEVWESLLQRKPDCLKQYALGNKLQHTGVNKLLKRGNTLS